MVPILIGDVGKVNQVVYEHAQVKKMLHYVNVCFLPFRWGTNSYRGCEHNCVYCNARYTHEYLGLSTGEFANRIVIKDNAAEVLDREFSKKTWNTKLTVNLATVTDPYQPAENRFRITRELLNVFLKHQNSLLLTTKSNLVLRDIDVLTEISREGFLNVAITLPTLDEELRKKIEPRAATVEDRLNTIQKLHEAGITVGVIAVPLLPFISDREEDVDELLKTVSDKGADYAVVDLLNFRGQTRDRFMIFLKTYDQNLIPKYEELYETSYCDKDFAKRIRSQANKLLRKYRVDNFDKMFSFRKIK